MDAVWWNGPTVQDGTDEEISGDNACPRGWTIVSGLQDLQHC